MRAEIISLALGVVLCMLGVALHRVGDDCSSCSIERSLSARVSNVTVSIVARRDGCQEQASCQHTYGRVSLKYEEYGLTVNDLLRSGLVALRLHMAGKFVSLAGELVALLFSPWLLSFRLDCSLQWKSETLAESDC